MDVEIRGTVKYPMIQNDHGLIMSIRALERTSISSASSNRMASTAVARPGVRAATLLNPDLFTEVIDVNRLAKKKSSLIQYVEIADSAGRLYCVNGLVNASCWIKIINLAKDCQSSNVILMSTSKGVVLKTIRVISPGEPLLLWFTENILAMMNMPFLTPYLNIQGENRYICHICHDLFEYPNPLKIHLALKCDKLDSNHLWSNLAKEFVVSLSGPRSSLPPLGPPAPPGPSASLTLNLFSAASLVSAATSTGSSFKFQLSQSISNGSSSLPRISPISVESPTSSNGPSPSSSTQVSPTSSSTEVSPIRGTVASSSHRGSAFKPYMNKPVSFSCSSSLVGNHSPTMPMSHENYQANNQPQLPSASIHASDVHAAHMETYFSNIAKSKQGHLCVYCGKVYSRKYGLKIHIRTHTGYKPLKCKVCLRPFGDPSNLNKHVRLHADGETPYRCEHCGKVLVRRRDLERHIRSRHQDNPGHISDTSSDGLEV